MIENHFQFFFFFFVSTVSEQDSDTTETSQQEPRTPSEESSPVRKSLPFFPPYTLLFITLLLSFPLSKNT